MQALIVVQMVVLHEKSQWRMEVANAFYRLHDLIYDYKRSETRTNLEYFYQYGQLTYLIYLINVVKSDSWYIF